MDPTRPPKYSDYHYSNPDCQTTPMYNTSDNMQSPQHNYAPPPEMSSTFAQSDMSYPFTQPGMSATYTPSSIPASTFSPVPTPTSSPTPLWHPRDMVGFSPPTEDEIRRRGMDRSTKLVAFPIKQSLSHIGAIVLGNTICVILIVVCLYTASERESISVWEKRAFNFSVILLTAILSLGIGNFVDELGLLSRGKVLATNAHSELSIAYIIRGSMSGVAHLLVHHIFQRPGTFNRTTIMACLYLVFSVAARLSVAVIGLTFNLSESMSTNESPVITKWVNPGEIFTDIHSESHNMSLDTLHEYATYAVRIKSPDVAAREANLTADTTEEVRKIIAEAFTAQELVQKLDPEQPIATFEYTLREFGKNTAIGSSNRTVVITTECHTYVVPSANIIPGELALRSTRDDENITFTSPLFDAQLYPLDGFAAERIFIPPNEVTQSSCGPLCHRIWLWDRFLNSVGEATYMCENRIKLPPALENSKVPDEVNIPLSLAEYILRFHGDSEAKGIVEGFHHRDVTDLEGYTNMANAIGLDFNYANGEIWTAAVFGRMTAVLVAYLDEALPKVPIRDNSYAVRSSLLVNWDRVVTAVSVMMGLQLLLTAATVWYCKDSVLIPDEISPLGDLIGRLSIPRSSTLSSIISHITVDPVTGRRMLRARFQPKARSSQRGPKRWILEVESRKEASNN